MLTVLLFSLVVTLLTAILVGLVPALTASRLNLNQTLSEGGSKMSGERSGLRTRSALVIAEVAVTVVLLAGATLILRSFVNLSRVNLGFDPNNVLTMHLRVQGAKYSHARSATGIFSAIDRTARSAARRRGGERGLDSSDGRHTSAGTCHLRWKDNRTPKRRRTACRILKPSRRITSAPSESRSKPGANLRIRIPTSRPPVAIISETMAKTLFGAGVDPLGKRLKLDFRDASWLHDRRRRR